MFERDGYFASFDRIRRFILKTVQILLHFYETFAERSVLPHQLRKDFRHQWPNINWPSSSPIENERKISYRIERNVNSITDNFQSSDNTVKSICLTI